MAVVVVMGHCDEMRFKRDHGKIGKIRLNNSFCQLPRPVEPEIKKNDAIVVPDALIVDQARLNKFVIFSRGIGVVDGLFPARDLFAFTQHDCPIGKLGPVPAVVAVHCIVTADDARYAADSNGVDALLQ